MKDANEKKEQNAAPAPLEIVDNFEMPATVRTGNRGSKYYPRVVEEAIEALKAGQGVIVPFTEGIEPAKNRQMVSIVLKNYFKGTGKEFSVGLLEGKGIAVRLDRIVEVKAENAEKKAA